MTPQEWPHIRSIARWVLPVLVGPRIARTGASERGAIMPNVAAHRAKARFHCARQAGRWRLSAGALRPGWAACKTQSIDAKGEADAPPQDELDRHRNTKRDHMARVYSAATRTLVTGGAGFLGSHLCDRLIKEGHEVLCVDNLFT